MVSIGGLFAVAAVIFYLVLFNSKKVKEDPKKRSDKDLMQEGFYLDILHKLNQEHKGDDN